MGANDAPGQGRQSALKNRHPTKILRKLWVNNPFSWILFSSLQYISKYNPHTILKNAPLKWTTITFVFICFYMNKLQMGILRKLWRFSSSSSGSHRHFVWTLYVRLINSIHFMSDEDENMNWNAHNVFKYLVHGTHILAHNYCSPWDDASFAPICSTCS